MMSTPSRSRAPLANADLELALDTVERHLAGLGSALLEKGSQAIDIQASELQRSLTCVVNHLSHAAAHHAALPLSLRFRLTRASSQVAAQRESFGRATAALDRAIQVLLPQDSGGLYSSSGGAERNLTGGTLLSKTGEFGD